MPKNNNSIYDNMCNISNVIAVYNNIRNHVNNKKIIYRFDMYKSVNLYRILDDLIKRKYVFGKYNIFLIKEPKYRIILSENINDKIVNHLVSRYILLPLLEPKLIDSNVATRKNKGSGHGFKLLKNYLRQAKMMYDNFYILKIDIRKYFYNINHNILKEKLAKDIIDKDALKIAYDIIDTTNEKYVNDQIRNIKNNTIKKLNKLNLKESDREKRIKEIENIPFYIKDKGLGIGNMSNQVFAVYYLNDVDH